MDSKNKIVVITSDDYVAEVKAKLLEKGYKNMEVNPAKIDEVEVAIITKTGVAEGHSNLVTDLESLPKKEESGQTKDDVKIKTSGKELPSTEQSKENVSKAAVENPDVKSSADESKQSVKNASINTMDESYEDAEKRYSSMSRSKGFGF